MAEAVETIDVILTAEQADHINAQHVDLNQHTRTSKFYPSFNLTAKLGLLSCRTWETRNDVELLERGWKQGHSDFYIYVFSVRKKVGTDPNGFLAVTSLCIFRTNLPSPTNFKSLPRIPLPTPTMSIS